MMYRVPFRDPSNLIFSSSNIKNICIARFDTKTASIYSTYPYETTSCRIKEYLIFSLLVRKLIQVKYNKIIQKKCIKVKLGFVALAEMNTLFNYTQTRMHSKFLRILCSSIDVCIFYENLISGFNLQQTN